MGQNASTQKGEANQQIDSASQTFGDSTISSSAPSMSFVQSRAEFNHIKHNLTRFELRSLQAAFHEMKTTFSDNFECIELKKFLEVLDLAPPVESAGILLFKSFSYLASFPQCEEAGPIPLTLHGFITAFAIMSGKLEKDAKFHADFQDLFLNSIAVIPAAQQQITKSPQASPEISPADKNESPPPANRGLSLADLGVSFDEDEQTKSPALSADSSQDMKILCRDVSSILAFLLWIVRMAWSESNQPRSDQDPCQDELEMASVIVNTISGTSYSEDPDTLPCVSKAALQSWRSQYAPNLYNGLHTSLSDIISPNDIAPKPDETELLTPTYAAILNWSLPQTALSQKLWNLLYNADRDGYAMNNFISHVFKYPGPTLLLLQVEAIGTATSSLSLSSSYQALSLASSIPKHDNSPFRRQSSSAHLLNEPVMMLLGAYIPEPWKQPKQYWGSQECFLFELGPNYEIYKPIGKGQQYIYCHRDFGIAFGGTSSYNGPPAPLNSSRSHRASAPNNAFLLTLDDNLQKGTYVQDEFPAAPTFGEARTRQKFAYFYETVSIEAFGLGGKSARATQQSDWQFDKKEAERRAGVNIRKGGKGVDRQLLRMAGVLDDDVGEDKE
ncbi:hypothetical protein NQZ79_g5169 [Umbelopsis isabellina]|nr:hypothetical protein NQZ79_g5169 [Umbelopsis isabellina]